jgi:hypothetical protein
MHPRGRTRGGPARRLKITPQFPSISVRRSAVRLHHPVGGDQTHGHRPTVTLLSLATVPLTVLSLCWTLPRRSSTWPAFGCLPTSRGSRCVRCSAAKRPRWRQAFYDHYYGTVAPPRAGNWIALHEILGVRSKTSKLVFYPTWKGGAFWEFFDLANDPQEMHNLYADPSHAENVVQMKRQLRALVDQYQDTEAAKMLDDLKESGNEREMVPRGTPRAPPTARSNSRRVTSWTVWPGRGVSARVPGVWWRHPADRVHHRARADPEDSDTRVASYRVANRSNHLASRRPVVRRPTGESSCRSTFDRAIFQASPDELPVIDIHSL